MPVSALPFSLILGYLCFQANGQSEGDLRLVSNFGFSGGSSGRLEIYHDSEWGTVCDDSFGSTDADVACGQLGYVSASRHGTVGAVGFSQASSSTPTWLTEVVCFGTESRLASCIHNGYGNTGCSHSEDVALVCRGQAEGDLRLVSSFGETGGSSGRLEIYHDSEWGTICVDSFGSAEAIVACRQLGFLTATRFGTVGLLGFARASIFTPTWLDEVDCIGFESRLASCNNNGFGNEDCDHSQDVAVACTGITFNVIAVGAGVAAGGLVLIILIISFICCMCCVCKRCSKKI